MPESLEKFFYVSNLEPQLAPEAPPRNTSFAEVKG